MKTIRTSELKMYFTAQQETDIQKDIVASFTGTVRQGIYSVVMMKQGKITEYYLGFIVEQPDNPRPFIITILMEAVVRTSRGRFERDVEQVLEKAHKLPERGRALLRNQQQIKN